MLFKVQGFKSSRSDLRGMKMGWARSRFKGSIYPGTPRDPGSNSSSRSYGSNGSKGSSGWLGSFKGSTFKLFVPFQGFSLPQAPAVNFR